MKSSEISEIEVKLLLDAIYQTYNYDFRKYSLGSVKRRLSTAMGHFNVPTLSRLQERVLHDPNFFSALLQFMTIPTSEMFRDPLFFKSFREQVVPNLKTYPSIKFWIAGCSTGEEVYSYAILLKEEGLLDRTTIYATDINPVSLKKAEEGIFAADRMKVFAENYFLSGGSASLMDYFSVAYNSAMVEKSFRKNIVFADHSLATDSVFSETQVISCRNVLIYFNRDLQDRALGLFHESLSHRGFLALGSKESLRFSSYSDYFIDFVKEQKIFQRK